MAVDDVGWRIDAGAAVGMGPRDGGVGVQGRPPAVPTFRAVVVAAQEDAVIDRGRPVRLDRDDVVDVTPRRRAVTAVEPAATVAFGDGLADCGRPHSGGGADIQWPAVAVDDDPGDRAVVEQPRQRATADRPAPVDGGWRP
jgi:hypothetical protein